MTDLTINYLLAHNCSNPISYAPLSEEDLKGEPEWHEFVISLHCVELVVEARKVKDGQFAIGSDEWEVVPEYEIRKHYFRAPQ